MFCAILDCALGGFPLWVVDVLFGCKDLGCAVTGHTNVFYVGDRVKKANQLNGKSANLNYVLLNKIYPNARGAQDVPVKDIFMVMDCDHMVGFLYLSP